MTHSRDFAKGFVGLLGNDKAIGEAFHITSDEVLTWDQIYCAVGAGAGLSQEPTLFHVTSDFIRAIKPELEGTLHGDKNRSLVFDNSKIKRFVPDFKATTLFVDGVREAVEYIMAHKELQVEDVAFDSWTERLIKAHREAAEKIKDAMPKYKYVPVYHEDKEIMSTVETTEYGLKSFDFGNIKKGKITELKPGSDYDVEGCGRMFGQHMASDEGRFVYARMEGNFDVSVQMAELFNPDRNMVAAGLMVRKDFNSDGLFTSVAVAGNDYVGDVDQYVMPFRMMRYGSIDSDTRKVNDGYYGRGAHGNETLSYFSKLYVVKNQMRPRPFPDVWVRLNRTGRRYTGYYKEGNGDWIKIGDTFVDLGDSPYVGMYVAAQEHRTDPYEPTNPDTFATVKFRNLTGLTVHQ